MTSLSRKKQQEITEIVGRCNEKDGSRYSAPLDADRYFFSADRGRTVSFAALYGMGETYGGLPVCEVVLCTDPEHRKEGAAGRILGRIRKAYPEGTCIFRFAAYVTEVSESFARKKGMIRAWDELLMELCCTDGLRGALSRREDPEKDPFTVTDETDETEEGDGSAVRRLRFENAHSELSVLRSGDSAYIYNVRTDAAHLREGSAGRLLSGTLSALFSDGAAKAVLQVSSENTAALRLYEGRGFTVAETVRMWYTKLK